jgi:hypothetical protein
VLRDHDFHPDEPTVQIFRTSSPGVLRLDDSVAISEAAYDRVVLRHYAFADHWYKVNVTTGLGGRVIESGEGDRRFTLSSTRTSSGKCSAAVSSPRRRAAAPSAGCGNCWN